MKVTGTLLSAALAVALAACASFASWDGLSKSWVGHPITDITKLWGEPSTQTKLSDGSLEYKYVLKKLDPSCVHYWRINSSGIITDYHYEGYCKPIG